MRVHLLTDDPAKVPLVRGLLEPRHVVEVGLLDESNAPVVPNGGVALIVDADLSCADRVEKIKDAVKDADDIERLFVVPERVRRLVVQAHALGATRVLSRVQQIVPALASLAASRSSRGTSGAVGSESGDLAQSAAAFSAMFSAIADGRTIDIADARTATDSILESITHNGLTNWLADVREHHEGTFQHCLLVTGVAICFGLHLGFADEDVRRLGMAATLHDVGKAAIPRHLLDKRGRLDEDEAVLMRRHPELGYELLKRSAIDADILDVVRHHHEFLDGTGYPDGLSGCEISDLVRLVTIADIFAALIETRAYKKPMSREKAYEMMCGMKGKLEPALLEAFSHVALST